MENIVFERIWDSSFFIVKITAESELIKASIDNLYMTNSAISDLSDLLMSIPFPAQDNAEYYWKYSSDDSLDAEISFTISQKDKTGRMRVEVYMLIRDESIRNDHFCRFYINTEIGLLNTFGKRLLSLSKSDEKIALTGSENYFL